MTQRRSLVVATTALTLLATALVYAQGTTQPQAGGSAGIEPAADRALREMSDFLGKVQTFSFHVDATDDAINSSGLRVQLGMAEDVSVRRPGRIRVNFTGDEHRGSMHSDGLTFVVYDAAENTFARTVVSDDLVSALDHMWAEYSVDVPVADFVLPDPYAALTEQVEGGWHVGKHRVQGVLCDHLVFTQAMIDWQIWIEDGPKRLPRKFVITYIDRPGEPQYTAMLSRWNLHAHMSDHIFRFDPPAGAEEVEFLPVHDGDEPDGGVE